MSNGLSDRSVATVLTILSFSTKSISDESYPRTSHTITKPARISRSIATRPSRARSNTRTVADNRIFQQKHRGVKHRTYLLPANIEGTKRRTDRNFGRIKTCCAVISCITSGAHKYSSKTSSIMGIAARWPVRPKNVIRTDSWRVELPSGANLNHEQTSSAAILCTDWPGRRSLSEWAQIDRVEIAWLPSDEPSYAARR